MKYPNSMISSGNSWAQLWFIAYENQTYFPTLYAHKRCSPSEVEAQQPNTLLMIACQNNNRRIAKYLLGCDVNINAKNEKGNTALHICYQWVSDHDLMEVMIRFNYTTLAEFLIANGADETIKNNDGVLPHMMQKSPWMPLVSVGVVVC